jgi:CRISPR/Cas system-associated exonuclease Cas4 (RecB family)
VAHGYKEKMKHGEEIQENEKLDYFSAVFDVEKSHTAWYEDEDPGQVKDLGVGIMKVHHQLVSPDIIPLAVEKGFIMSLTKRKQPGDDPDKPPEKYPPIEGYIDTVDKDGVVCEVKTSRSKKKEIDPAHKLQTTIYAAGMKSLGAEVPGARVDYMIKTKSPYPITIPFEIQLQDWLFFSTVLESVYCGIQNEHFWPNRSSNLCSRRWCGYWPECEKKFHGKVKD